MLDGNVVRFTPTLNFVGVASFTYLVSDGHGGSDTATTTLRVDPVNDAPVLLSALADAEVVEDSPINVLLPEGSFADIDGDTLVLTARLANGAALPSWLSFDGSRFTGTPPANFNGFFDIEVSASDGSLVATDSFRLTIDPVNDAPVLFVALADRNTAEDRLIDFIIPANSFADVDNGTLTLSATLTNGAALPSWLSFDGSRFTGTPPANFNGAIDLLVTASDGTLTASDDFRLTVTPVNDAPVAVNDSGLTVAVGNSLTIAPATFLANDIDVDGDVLSITAVSDAVGGTVALVNGQIVFTSTLTSAGTGSFTYTVSDGLLTSTAVATVAVTGGTVPLVFGTSRNDILNGQPNAINRIDGLAGNDTITGGNLNDELVGGTGNDIIYGRSGDDTIIAGAGNDIVTGDAGNDVIDGGAGNDDLYGGAGNDTVTAGDGNDTVTGDAGNDVIDGGLGNDTIYAGAGDDVLSGGGGNDELFGDDGNDVITGGAGNDRIFGGSGSDTLVLAGLRSSYTISTVNGSVRVTDNQPNTDGNDGTDIISGIEILRFRDGTTLNIVSPIILDLDGNGVRTVGLAGRALEGDVGSSTPKFVVARYAKIPDLQVLRRVYQEGFDAFAAFDQQQRQSEVASSTINTAAVATSGTSPNFLGQLRPRQGFNSRPEAVSLPKPVAAREQELIDTGKLATDAGNGGPANGAPSNDNAKEQASVGRPEFAENQPQLSAMSSLDLRLAAMTQDMASFASTGAGEIGDRKLASSNLIDCLVG